MYKVCTYIQSMYVYTGKRGLKIFQNGGGAQEGRDYLKKGGLIPLANYGSLRWVKSLSPTGLLIL